MYSNAYPNHLQLKTANQEFLQSGSVLGLRTIAGSLSFTMFSAWPSQQYISYACSAMQHENPTVTEKLGLLAHHHLIKVLAFTISHLVHRSNFKITLTSICFYACKTEPFPLTPLSQVESDQVPGPPAFGKGVKLRV